MSGEWTDTTIGDQVLLQRGIDITRAEQRPGLVPVVSSGGISSFHDEFISEGPGVVLGRKGVVGSVWYIEGNFWPHDTTLWVRDFKGNVPRFVYYFFKSMGRELAGLDVGSANPTLNRNHVHPLSVTWPSVREQRAIAKVLGSLDDKIELNRKMSATLEEMARALFKSWFVDFDPVRAKADGRKPSGMDAETAKLFPGEFVESELGPLPKGWRTGTIGDLSLSHNARRVPLSARERRLRQGPYSYYGAASVVDSVDDFLFEGRFVLVGEDGSVVSSEGFPFVQYVWGRFWVNNHAHVLLGTEGVSQEHLYLALCQSDVRPYVTGAVQAKLNQGNLRRVPVVVAPSVVNRSFGRVVGPLFDRFRSLAEESKTLAMTRDELLPRILSGELPVAAAEPQVEQVA